MLRERTDRPLALERERRGGSKAVVRRAVIRHVLADALLPAAAQPDLRRRPDELARDGLFQLLQLTALDEQRQVCNLIEGGHNGEYVDAGPPRRDTSGRHGRLRQRRAARG